MNREELLIDVYSRLPRSITKKLSQREVKSIISIIFEAIKNALMTGEQVSIYRFGRFLAVPIKCHQKTMLRKGNGKYITMSRYIRINFKPSLCWKKIMREFMED